MSKPIGFWRLCILGSLLAISSLGGCALRDSPPRSVIVGSHMTRPSRIEPEQETSHEDSNEDRTVEAPFVDEWDSEMLS